MVSFRSSSLQPFAEDHIMLHLTQSRPSSLSIPRLPSALIINAANLFCWSQRGKINSSTLGVQIGGGGGGGVIKTANRGWVSDNMPFHLTKVAWVKVLVGRKEIS
ncbi:hypothetical protein OIU84_011344 [Salix udensis]|uniref:Uncharacterized protein n=1 Tax=Salix udensis TaxID=889485 RepID=A0AAD6JMX1_9ROSI|nr:hypothetical protein OIU84_011344 [Salix udensis]